MNPIIRSSRKDRLKAILETVFRKPLFISAMLCLLIFSSSLLNAQVLHSSTDSVMIPNSYSAVDRAGGFHFSPKQDLYVAKLGKRVSASGTYSWVLWDFDTKTKIYQQNSQVNDPGNYAYEDVTSRSPITLEAGKEYALILYGIGNTYMYEGTSSQIGDHLDYFDCYYYYGIDTNTFPTNQISNYHFGTPDFLYSLTPLNRGMNDASVLSVDSPSTFCAGMHDIYATIANFGYNQIDSVDIYWEFNGVLQPVIEYKQLLDTIDGNSSYTAQVFLGSAMFANGVENTIKVWTSNPNGVADTVNIGDSLTVVKKAAIFGNITIDASQAQSSSNYTSFSSLASDLNNYGICGPLNVNVAPGTYLDYFNLNDVPGSSAINTITIDGQDASLVTLRHSAKAPFAAVTLNGSKYVSILNMTIDRIAASGGSSDDVKSGGGGGSTVVLTGNAHHNLISDNILIVDTNTISSGVANVVFSGSSSSITSGAKASSNTVQNNMINGGYYGIYLQGSTTDIPAQNKILNNTMWNQYYYGIYMYYSDSTEIVGNTIDMSRNTYAYGIMMYYTNNLIISENDINLQVPNGYGIYTYNYSTYKPANRRIQIKNNMVITGGTGLYLYYLDDADIFHNSISTFGNYQAALFYSNSGGLDVRNNIFSTVNAVAFESSSPHGIFHRFDNNAFYSENRDLLRISNVGYNDLASYHTDYPFFNVASIEGKPDFLNPTEDLHIFSSAYGNDLGDNSVNVLEDIDGEVRPIPGASTVDMGADEFEPPVCFAVVDAIAFNEGLDSISLSWEGGLGNTFQYEIVSKGQSQNPANIVTTTLDEVRVGNLNPSTVYEYYVRQICAPGDTSPWRGPIEFNTKFLIPFVEDYQSSYPKWDNGWTINTIGLPSWKTGAVSNYPGNTGPDMDHTIGVGGIFAYLNADYNAGNSILTSPIIDTDSNEYIEFSFWYHMYGSNMGALNVYVDTNGVANLITSINGQQQGSAKSPWQRFSTYLIGYDGQDMQIRFEAVKGSGSYSAMAIDDVALDIVPSLNVGLTELTNKPICAGSYTPIVNLKNFGQEDVDSVKIYWEVNGNLDSMMYSTTLLMGDVVPVSLNPISLTSTSTHNIKIYTSSPNSSADIFNSNDTLSFENVKTGLSGSYSIDASLPASASNYTSFASAVADLDAFGICGPTTFNVASGLYNEAVVINEIVGASSVNTVTFDGGSAATTSIIHDGSTSIATFLLSGADYITLTNLHIEYTGGAGATVLFAYGTDYNTISNCELMVDSNSSAYELNNLVFSGNDYSATGGAMANYNTIEDNTINGGYASIYMQGSATSILVGNKITNNQIRNGYYYAVQAYYHDSVEVVGNRMTLNPMNDYSYGVYMYYTNNSLINKNFIHLQGYYGIYYYNYNTYRPANRRIQINNNMIIADGTYMYGNYGMYMSYVDSVDMLHNSISVHGQNPAIILYNYRDYDLRNNILSSATGTAITANGLFSFNNMDNNLYRSNGANLLNIDGINYADLATYQAASPGFNSSSMEGDPQFTSPSDLHIFGSVVNDQGTSTYITEDIDGDSRPISGLNVDIGADEFNPPSCPPLLNLGASTITTSTADIHWTGLGTEFAYQIGAPGFTIGNASADSIVINDTVSLTGLNPSTEYEFYVREICGRGDTSIWTGPYSFITQCTPITSYPYTESFESGNGGWFAQGSNSSWELGVPDNAVIDQASDGNNAWVTSLKGNYNDNEASYVLSTCLDFTALDYPSIEMDVFWNSEFSWDGANLQASTDGGLTWSNVGFFGDPDNWYTDNTITGAPGGSQEGWTGRASTSNGSGEWVRAKHELFALAGVSDVLLRVNFGSDGSVVDEGFAFDNIIIADKVDLDAAVASIVSPAGVFCTGTYAPLVELRNEGKDTITSVKVLYSVNGALDSVIYNGTILPFSSQNVSLNAMTFNSGVTYDIHIYTKDPNGGIDGLTTNDSLSFTNLETGLSGAYSIDASLPASSTNFTSFNAAVDALNNYGVCGPVVITVAAGTYNESVTISEISGGSSVNTVTFDGVDSSTTVLTHNGSTTLATLTLDGADHLIVKNLGIETTNAANGATVLFKDADHNLITNCHLNVTNKNEQYNLQNVIFSSSTSSSTTNSNSNLNTIANNHIEGGYYGIWMYGDASNVNVGNKVLENKIEKVGYYGVYCYIQDSLEIIGNTILSLGNSNGYGLQVYYSNNTLIHDNYIHAKMYALYYYNYNTYRPANREIEFVNNMIISDNGPGMYLYYTTDVKVYHNSVSSNQAAFSTLYGTVSNYDVRNNIFKSKYDYTIESTHASTIFTAWDNNVYETQGSDLMMIANTNYADLAAVQAAVPAFNLFSLEGDPQFISATDLHIDGSFVNDKGDNSTGVTVDIDGDTRPFTGALSVDIGADEFDPPSCAAVLNLGAIDASPDSVSLIWDGLGNDFQYEIVDFRAAQGTGTIVGSFLDSVRVGGLSDNTVYDFFVREICSRGDTSKWAGPFTFKTMKKINDLGIMALVQPVNISQGCYSSAEAVELAIVNFGNVAVDFNTDSADINVEVSGAASQIYDVRISDNLLNNGLPLEAGDTLFVSMGTLDMTTVGDYTFSSTVEFDIDMLLNNNTSRVLVSNKTSGGTLSGTTVICGSATETLDANNAMGDLQWQRLVAGVFVDEVGADSNSYEVFIDSTTTFRVVACGTEYSDTITLEVIEVPLAPVTTNDSVSSMCGISGDAVLTASSSSSTALFNWYDAATAGTLLASGDTLLYPYSSSTTAPAGTYSDTVYVSEVNMGCEGPRTMAIATITIEKPMAPATVTDTAIVFCGDSGTAVLSASSTNSSDSFAWYDGKVGGNLLSNADTFYFGLSTAQQSFTTTYTDTFYVAAVDSATACESELSMVTGTVICTVGDEEIPSALSGISIHPNPSKGVFNLIGSNVEEVLDVSIYNSNGKAVYHMENKVSNNFNEQIDLSGFAKGMYFIKFQGDKSMEMRKVVIH